MGYPEITIFRDAPISVDNASTQDPFTEQSAQLTMPQITIFDTPGQGDLHWLVPNCNIDIVWENTGPRSSSGAGRATSPR